jgi:hypothetical protein
VGGTRVHGCDEQREESRSHLEIHHARGIMARPRDHCSKGRRVSIRRSTSSGDV